MAEKPDPVTSTAVVVVTTDNEQHVMEDGQLLQAEAVVVEEPDNAVRPDDKVRGGAHARRLAKNGRGGGRWGG